MTLTLEQRINVIENMLESKRSCLAYYEREIIELEGELTTLRQQLDVQPPPLIDGEPDPTVTEK